MRAPGEALEEEELGVARRTGGGAGGRPGLWVTGNPERPDELLPPFFRALPRASIPPSGVASQRPAALSVLRWR